MALEIALLLAAALVISPTENELGERIVCIPCTFGDTACRSQIKHVLGKQLRSGPSCTVTHWGGSWGIAELNCLDFYMKCRRVDIFYFFTVFFTF